MSSLLVTVNKITDIQPIVKADKIELATVLGWQCIVGKDQYKVGNLVVFIPPDSILPSKMVEDHKLEFLRKNGRVGVLKMRGVVSQGLVLPNFGNWKEGEEISKILGITKWEEADAGLSTGSKGKQPRLTSKKKLNPNFFKYNDIENIRNYPGAFKPFDEVVITEKVHGANARIGWLPLGKGFINWVKKLFGQTHELVYGSRTVQISGNMCYKGFYGEDVYGYAFAKYHMAEKCKMYPNLEFFGEVYGPKIQDLTYGKNTIDLIFFDIKDTRTEKYLDWDEAVAIFKKLNLPYVPELYRGLYSEEIVKTHTSGNSVIYPTQIREGSVVKLVKENPDARFGRKILKSISELYLTRKGGTEGK